MTGKKNIPPKQPQESQINPELCPPQEDNLDLDAVIRNALGGGKLPEGQPLFNQLACEDVWAGQNNTWIVLGRDRPAGASSKNLTSTQSGAIDIVAGRLGSAVRECIGGKVVWADPTFKADAARIYISQKSSIDYDFKLVGGTIGSAKTVQEPGGLSGIGIKADQVRIVGRRNIKLVTMGKQEPTSHGDPKVPPRSIQGINIIAGNETNGKNFRLEPMVKGYSLSEALKRLSVIVEQFVGSVHTSLLAQDRANAVLADHKHLWGEGKQITSCGISEMGYVSNEVKMCVDTHADTTMPDWEEIIKKCGDFRKDYCINGGAKYINSKWNFVN